MENLPIGKLIFTSQNNSSKPTRYPRSNPDPVGTVPTNVGTYLKVRIYGTHFLLVRCRGFLPAADPAQVAAGVWTLQHGSANWASRKLALEPLAPGAHPFAGLRIADTEPLNRQPGREPCPTCSKSRKFFCYTCHVPVASLGRILFFL